MGWGRSVCGVPASGTLQLPHIRHTCMQDWTQPTMLEKRIARKRHPHTPQIHTHTHICTHYRSPQISLSRLEMKSKPSNDLRSLHARVGGWVRDGNLDGVVELDMPKDYKLTPLALPRDQSIKPTITTSALNISPTANL